jgi:hypothetical protein
MTRSQKPKKANFIYALITCALIIFVLLYVFRDNEVSITQYSSIDRPAKVQPDYAGSVIPPNIAPLNFIIQQEGAGYFVRIYSEKGNPIEIFSRKPTILTAQYGYLCRSRRCRIIFQRRIYRVVPLSTHHRPDRS